MKTDTDVGLYTAAVKVKGILVAVVNSLGSVLLPRMSFFVESKLIYFLAVVSKGCEYLNCFYGGTYIMYS